MRVWRVHPPKQRLCVLKWILVWMSACFLVLFTLGPLKSPCHPCDCYCSSAESPLDTLDCGEHDPVMNEEINKDLLTMLSEELNLQTIVTNETLEYTERLEMNARRASSHYQMETEKCNAAMETCEEARERAEAELIEERRVTALWENRALEYGWKDKRRTRLRS